MSENEEATETVPVYRTRVQRSIGRPTRNDVARQAETSGATVSRVLSGRTDIPISPETRAKVIAAAQELGYMPNPSARALNKGRSNLIGFWMSLHYSRYRGQVLDTMRAQLSASEMALAVSDVDEEYQWDHTFSRAMRTAVDGIIAFDSISLGAFASQRARHAPTTPFVSMGAFWAESLSYVGVDLRVGAEVAMRHLFETGRRRIAYMAPLRSGLVYSGARAEGYTESMQAAGYEPEIIVVENTDLRSVRAALDQELPEAILCMNDDLAMFASAALFARGIRPGHDIALVGFDGIEEGELCVSPITTVRQPIEEMCRTALEFLTAQMEDPTAPPGQKILTPELIVRESSMPGSADSPSA